MFYTSVKVCFDKKLDGVDQEDDGEEEKEETAAGSGRQWERETPVTLLVSADVCLSVSSRVLTINKTRS